MQHEIFQIEALGRPRHFHIVTVRFETILKARVLMSNENVKLNLFDSILFNAMQLKSIEYQ